MTQAEAYDADGDEIGVSSGARPELLEGERERAARERLFDDVLASVELVLVADGAAFWREELDHSLVLTASRSISSDVLEALDRHVTTPLQSIMQRWTESPLVAVPLNDPSNPIAEEIRQIAEKEEIVGLAGVPCRVLGEMLGMLVVVHHRPHPWTVRDLGLATGLAGQLATAMQNARLYASVRSLANRLAAIHELSLRLNQLRDVEAIGQAIVSEVGRLVDCDTARVYRLDAEAMERCRRASTSPPLEKDLPWPKRMPMSALSSASSRRLSRPFPLVTAKRCPAGSPRETSRSSFRMPRLSDVPSSARVLGPSRYSWFRCRTATSSTASSSSRRRGSTNTAARMSKPCRYSGDMRHRQLSMPTTSNGSRSSKPFSNSKSPQSASCST